MDAWSSWMYEIVPGFAVNLVVTVLVSHLTYKPNAEIELEFDEAIRLLAPTPEERLVRR